MLKYQNQLKIDVKKFTKLFPQHKNSVELQLYYHGKMFQPHH